MAKLGFTGVDIIFLIFVQKHRLEKNRILIFGRKLLQFLVYRYAHMIISYGHKIYIADNK